MFFLAQHKGVLQDVAFDGQTLYSFNDLGDVSRHERDQSFLVPVRKKFWSRSRREKNFGPGPGGKKF
jgi:hypothetical protein